MKRELIPNSNSMEIHHHRRNSSSDDKFSFPALPAADYAPFAFGSTTSQSTPTSPADRLFSNGRLLPHSFPSQPSITTVHFSRSTSKTDSLLSSRSNSASSSNRSINSGCSSARTSTSDSSSAAAAAERKLFCQHAAKIAAAAAATRGDEFIWSQYQSKKPVLKPHYSSSQRWQFIAPAPGLRHQNSTSRSRKVQCVEVRDEGVRGKKKTTKGRVAAIFRWGFFGSIVSSCKGCHAMNPPAVKDLTAK